MIIKDYNRISKIEYECNSEEMSIRKLDSYLAGAMIGNKARLRQQINLFEPLWYMKLKMNEKTGYKYLITETHIIVPHNQVQYFFTYKT